MSKDFFSEDIGLEPEMDFKDKGNIEVLIRNGSPKMIKEIEAIRQWIVKFCMTEKDTYPIYEDIEFGTRFHKLYGKKRIGFEAAEVQRDFEEGLPLCPAISEVTDFKLIKEGKKLSIKMKVKIYTGEELDINLEKIYTIK